MAFLEFIICTVTNFTLPSNYTILLLVQCKCLTIDHLKFFLAVSCDMAIYFTYQCTVVTQYIVTIIKKILYQWITEKWKILFYLYLFLLYTLPLFIYIYKILTYIIFLLHEEIFSHFFQGMPTNGEFLQFLIIWEKSLFLLHF
jgi:hypothetical protein